MIKQQSLELCEKVDFGASREQSVDLDQVKFWCFDFIFWICVNQSIRREAGKMEAD